MTCPFRYSRMLEQGRCASGSSKDCRWGKANVVGVVAIALSIFNAAAVQDRQAMHVSVIFDFVLLDAFSQPCVSFFCVEPWRLRENVGAPAKPLPGRLCLFDQHVRS